MPQIVIYHKLKRVTEFQSKQAGKGGAHPDVEADLSASLYQLHHFNLLLDADFNHRWVEGGIQRVLILKCFHFVQLNFWQHAIGKIPTQPATGKMIFGAGTGFFDGGFYGREVK